MNVERVICIGGRKSSGKSTLSKECVKAGYSLMSFGFPLKNFICKMLNIDLKRLEELKNDTNYKIDFMSCRDFVMSELKIPINSNEFDNVFNNKFTMREILQNLGTNIIRKIDNDWFIKKLNYDIDRSHFKKIVIDDLRYQNEKKFIKEKFENKAKFFYVLSPYNNNISNHISEIDLGWRDFKNEYILVNYYNDEFIENFLNFLNNKVRDFEFFNKYSNNLINLIEIIYKFGFKINVDYFVDFENGLMKIKKKVLELPIEMKLLDKKDLDLLPVEKWKYTNFNLIDSNYYYSCNPFYIEDLKINF